MEGWLSLFRYLIDTKARGDGGEPNPELAGFAYRACKSAFTTPLRDNTKRSREEALEFEPEAMSPTILGLHDAIMGIQGELGARYPDASSMVSPPCLLSRRTLQSSRSSLLSSFPSNLIAVLSSPPLLPCLLSCRPPHDCHPPSSSGRHPACRRHHRTATPIIFLIAAASSSPFHLASGILQLVNLLLVSAVTCVPLLHRPCRTNGYPPHPRHVEHVSSGLRASSTPWSPLVAFIAGNIALHLWVLHVHWCLHPI
jgi:hypothetical protein